MGGDGRLGERFVGHSELRPACRRPEDSLPLQGGQVSAGEIGPEIDGDEERRERVRREDVSPLLSVFHLDGGCVEEDVLHLYCRLYALRRGTRKSEWKKNLALAFCIARVLTRHKCPRPIDDILLVCGVPLADKGHLLQMAKWLNLRKEELESLEPDDYEWEDTSPQHYIDTLCSHLGIPFAAASEMEEVARGCEYALYGRQPSVLAAAAMQVVLRRRGFLALNPALAEEVCKGLGCQQRAVNEVLRSAHFRRQQRI